MRRGVLLVLIAFLGAAPGASGHVSPDGCSGAHLSYDFGYAFGTLKRNGDVITIRPKIGNDNPPSGACDVTDASVTLTFPSPAGTSNGKQFSWTGLDFPAGSAPQALPRKRLTIDFDPGVFRGPVTLAVSGVVHEADVDSWAPVSSDWGMLIISRPRVTLSVSPDVSPHAPFTVEYTYSAENDSASDPAGAWDNPPPSVFDVTVSDDHCSPVAFSGGDTDPDAILSKGETWVYTCARSLPRGSLVDVATFTGVSGSDGRPWPKRTVRTAFCERQIATIIGTDKADKLAGTAGPDVIVARDGDDVVEGLAGDDIICGGAGRDTLRGMGGADTLRGEGGPDKLIGGAGIDTLIGGPGADIERQ